MRTKARKPKGAKKVSYTLIPRESETGARIYAMLDDLVAQHHDVLTDARIALAWCTSWRPDVDGRVILGKCKKASDLDRELVAFDFIILLSQSFWQSLSVTYEQRRALLDHELSHASVKLSQETGEPERDERGRVVYRIRKHDLEEFAAVVERNGLYKKDLETFAQALARHRPARVEAAREEARAQIENCEDCGGTTYITVTAGDGREIAHRCHCFKDAQLQIAAADTTL